MVSNRTNASPCLAMFTQEYRANAPELFPSEFQAASDWANLPTFYLVCGSSAIFSTILPRV
jgi:hypothetical protein